MNSRLTSSLINLTILVSGATVLAIELATARLLGAVFGTSNIVWASIIGLVLIYLAGGYYIGGYWADYNPSFLTFYQIAAWAAFLSGLLPFAAKFILPLLTGLALPLTVSVILALLLLLAVPIVLLGCISPFAIRLMLTTPQEAGHVSGNIYAISTLGSVIGSLAPVLYMLPSLGTSTTYTIFSCALLLTALFALAQYDKQQTLRLLWMPLVVVLLATVL
ncbi:fused MFS/spermidine synthase [Chloroflexota bacterium]